MPIKHAEVTIIINLEYQSMLNYLNGLLGNENKTNDNDVIIVLFDDETVSDVKKEYINTKFNMGPISCDANVPQWFKITGGDTFFSKSPTRTYGSNLTQSYCIKKLNFSKIFASSNRYLTSKLVPSVYNSIYYRLSDNCDMFAIVKIKSNEGKPRFLVAYEDELFKKDDIIYLVNHLFSQINKI